ncbi:MAG: histidine--tRNA ligase [Bacilli bacterium]|nr:histidine--tRNA ligase [Bacilli bacterium]
MIQRPKGTYDLYGEDVNKVLYLRKLITALMDKYNYKYIKTPMFESSELFHRSVGETTDIVSKETYDFVDRGNRNITLRPEGTAGVVRAFIQNKLYADSMPFKVYYFGSMFRYERPQSGRNREFMQFGVETFGSELPVADAEVISIMVNFFRLLGLKDIKVNINTLGDIESRLSYRKALLEYFEPYLGDLCDDCKKRYKNNPLRILDCKVDGKKGVMKKAPKINDYLNEESKDHFEKVKEYLSSMGIDYVVNEHLVRGLDYYTHTVFEVEANIEGFGSGNVLGAGGRYNNLVEDIGGPKTPAVGFAIGIDRLLLALDACNIDLVLEETPDIYAFGLSDKEFSYTLSLVNKLRLSGFNVDMDLNGRNIKNNFKHADKIKAKFVLLVGEEEIKNNVLTLKDNDTKEEYKVEIENLIEFLDTKIMER